MVKEYTIEELSTLPKITPPTKGKKEADLSLNEVLVILPNGLAIIHDWEGHTIRIFSRALTGTDKYVDVTPDHKAIAKTLAEKLNSEMFMEDVVKTMEPEKQIKLAEMLNLFLKETEQNKKVETPTILKTKQDNRCAHLMVGVYGKQVTINLRGN